MKNNWKFNDSKEVMKMKVKYFSVRLKNKHRCKEVEFYCYSYHMKTAKTGNEILVFKSVDKYNTYKEYNSNEWFIMRISPVYYR